MPGRQRRARRRGHRAVGGRRPVELHDGAQPRGRRGQERRARRHHVLHASRLRRRCRVRRGGPRGDGGGQRASARSPWRGARASVRASRADRGRTSTRGCPTPRCGAARSACSDRSTRSRCSRAGTCTSTARRATTSPTSRSRRASTPTAIPQPRCTTGRSHASSTWPADGSASRSACSTTASRPTAGSQW